MALTTRKSVYSRFLLEGSVKALDTAAFEDALRAKRFMPIDATPDEKSFGWTQVDDINDYEFTGNTIARGEFYLFGLRIDKRSIPGATVRNELSKAIKAELQRTGKDYISRERRKELKEQITLKLRARQIPTPKVIQCVFNTANGMLYAATTSGPEVELIMDMVIDTFGETATPLMPGNLAEIEGKEIEDVTAKLNVIQGEFGDVDYKLMSEFLTWLWCKSETIGVEKHQLESGEFSYFIDGTVDVDEYNGREIVSVFKAKTNNEKYDFHDVKYGMWRATRGVRRMSICMSHGDDDYVITLDATKSFGLAVKTPPLHLNGESVTAESPFLEKMYFLQIAEGFIGDMFRRFIKARLTSRWERENTVIQQWLEASAPECERSAE